MIYLNLFVLLFGFILLLSALFSKFKIVFLILSAVTFGAYFGLPNENLLLYLLFVLGILLMTVELYVPDFGVTGVAGFIVMIIALYFVHSDFVSLIMTILAVLAVSIVTAIIHLAFGRELQISPQFVLKTSTNSERGYSTSKKYDELVSQQGVAVTPLRPVGKANFNGTIYEVISNEEMLATNTPIYVERVQGSKIYVRKEG